MSLKYEPASQVNAVKQTHVEPLYLFNFFIDLR